MVIFKLKINGASGFTFLNAVFEINNPFCLVSALPR